MCRHCCAQLNQLSLLFFLNKIFTIFYHDDITIFRKNPLQDTTLSRRERFTGPKGHWSETSLLNGVFVNVMEHHMHIVFL